MQQNAKVVPSEDILLLLEHHPLVHALIVLQVDIVERWGCLSAPAVRKVHILVILTAPAV